MFVYAMYLYDLIVQSGYNDFFGQIPSEIGLMAQLIELSIGK